MWLLWGKRIKNTNLGQIWIFSFKSISLRHSYKCLLLYFLSDRKNTLLHHLLFGTNSFFFSLKMKRLHLLCLYLCAFMPWFVCRGQRTTCGSWFSPLTKWVLGFGLLPWGLLTKYRAISLAPMGSFKFIHTLNIIYRVTKE